MLDISRNVYESSALEMGLGNILQVFTLSAAANFAAYNFSQKLNS
jgi:hypothetical protein